MKGALKIEAERVCVALDSLQSVEMVRGKIKAPWNLENLVKKIIRHFEIFRERRIIHIYREANHTTERIARSNNEGNPNFYFSLLPLGRELDQIVLDDSRGKMYTRLSWN